MFARLPYTLGTKKTPSQWLGEKLSGSRQQRQSCDDVGTKSYQGFCRIEFSHDLFSFQKGRTNSDIKECEENDRTDYSIQYFTCDWAAARHCCRQPLMAEMVTRSSFARKIRPTLRSGDVVLRAQPSRDCGQLFGHVAAIVSSIDCREPHRTRQPISRLLLRGGRAFGVCCPLNVAS